jgi:phosphoenolpyruvate carboxykinase (GTP)
MCDRVDGKVGARETAIGYLPEEKDLELAGLDISQANLAEILRVDRDAWQAEIPSIEAHYARFGDRLPKRLIQQVQRLKERLG